MDNTIVNFKIAKHEHFTVVEEMNQQVQSLRSSPYSPILVWIRNDLRLHDNPALSWAIEQNRPVFLTYIMDETESPSIGGAAKAWLKVSLSQFKKSLARNNLELLIYEGETVALLKQLQTLTKAGTIVFNRSSEPSKRKIEQELEQELGCEILTFKPNLLLDPSTLYTKHGKPFTVFTPFWKEATARIGVGCLPLCTIQSKKVEIKSAILFDLAKVSVSDDELLLKKSWEKKVLSHWEPGEKGALSVFSTFLEHAIGEYSQGRDYPSRPATSSLSPHLRFGEISPRYIWNTVLQYSQSHQSTNVEHFLRELGWREFAHYLLYHYPQTVTQPLREEFTRFPWQEDPALQHAWQKGMTGIPIVDAGMRQLWETGWMHNRVRMIVGSFLVKHLLQPWQKGAEWFWDTLVDADLANNTLGWQWVAGCGADAAPYFRIFNPVLQSEKFDAEGGYIRRYVPELKALPSNLIHAPWLASLSELRRYGVELGKTYPNPICDLAEGRNKALSAFANLKQTVPST